MNTRTWVNDNSAIVMILAVLLLLVALFFIFSMGDTPVNAQNRKQWLYNIDTKTLYKDSMTLVPPVKTEDGTAVMALVYACGDCDDDPQQIAYLRKLTDEGKRLQEEENKRMEELAKLPADAKMPVRSPGSMGYLRAWMVSREDPIKWYSTESREGAEIISGTGTACGDVKIKYCRAD